MRSSCPWRYFDPICSLSSFDIADEVLFSASSDLFFSIDFHFFWVRCRFFGRVQKHNWEKKFEWVKSTPDPGQTVSIVWFQVSFSANFLLSLLSDSKNSWTLSARRWKHPHASNFVKKEASFHPPLTATAIAIASRFVKTEKSTNHQNSFCHSVALRSSPKWMDESFGWRFLLL